MSLGDYQHLEIDEELQVDVHVSDDDVYSLDGNVKASRLQRSQSITLSHALNTSLSSLAISTPSDPARHWAVFLFSVTTILLYADQNLLGPNLSAVASEFGFSDEERDRKLGGDIALAFFLLGAPASLVVGCLADTSHRSRLFAMVVGIGEGACLLTYFSTTYSQLYVCRAITGFSVGGALPLIYSVLGDLFTSDERHAVSAVVGVGTGVGIALGQGVAGFLGPTFGWRLPFLIVSVPALVCALLVLLTVKDPERGGMEKVAVERRGISDRGFNAHNSRQMLLSDIKEKEPRTCYVSDNECRAPTSMKGSTTKLSIGDQHQMVKQDQIVDVYLDSIYDLGTPTGFDIYVHWRTFISLMSTPSVVLCLLQGAPGCVPWGIINTYLNDYLSEDQGMSVEGATATVLCFGIGSFCGLLIGGAGGQALYRINPRYPSVLAGVAAILGCFPFWMVLNTVNAKSSVVYIFVVTAFAGLCAGVTGPVVKANLQNVTLPTARGQAFAIYNTFDDFGRGLGPVFIALLISKYGSRRQAFNVGVLGWIMCGIFNILTALTIGKDEEKMHRSLEVTLAMVNGDTGKNILRKVSSNSNTVLVDDDFLVDMTTSAAPHRASLTRRTSGHEIRITDIKVV